MDNLLGSQATSVPTLFAPLLVALVGVGLMDVGFALRDGGPAYATLFLPGIPNYYLAYTMEALFADSAHAIFVRFCTINRQLEAACIPGRLRPADVGTSL